MRQDRLDKLFTFLLDLPNKKFDFTQWARNPDEEEPKCGTICCAGGWLPAVDPQYWGWSRVNEGGSMYPRPKGLEGSGYPIVTWISEYFGIDEGLGYALFMPDTESDTEGCPYIEVPNEDCVINAVEYAQMTPKLWVERAKRILAKVPSGAQ